MGGCVRRGQAHPPASLACTEGGAPHAGRKVSATRRAAVRTDVNSGAATRGTAAQSCRGLRRGQQFCADAGPEPEKSLSGQGPPRSCRASTRPAAAEQLALVRWCSSGGGGGGGSGKQRRRPLSRGSIRGRSWCAGTAKVETPASGSTGRERADSRGAGSASAPEGSARLGDQPRAGSVRSLSSTA